MICGLRKELAAKEEGMNRLRRTVFILFKHPQPKPGFVRKDDILIG